MEKRLFDEKLHCEKKLFCKYVKYFLTFMLQLVIIVIIIWHACLVEFGRHNRLKICRLNRLAGSSPAAGTSVFIYFGVLRYYEIKNEK